jgi:hypothetical protein
MEALAKAKSSISVSFDGWLADNQLEMLGVTAHYLDEQLRVKTFLLGLSGPRWRCNCRGATDCYARLQISDRIDYFVADNALNNDVALRQIAKEIDVDPS